MSQATEPLPLASPTAAKSAGETVGEAAGEEPARALIARVEGLLEELEQVSDDTARTTATELVQALLELYGQGIGRIVDVVAPVDDGTLARRFAEDELIAHLLLLHGLHPLPVQTRVEGALESVLPYLRSHGGSVQLLGVQDGVVALRLQGSCSGCPSSAMTLRSAIERAIFDAAPDVVEVRAEGVAEPAAAASGLLQIECPSELRGAGA